MQKLVFDTLKYAKMLTNGGVDQSEVHAESLAEALSHNVYIKSEVDNMLEDVIRESRQQFNEQMRRMERETNEIKAEMKAEKTEMKAEMKAEISKIFNRNIVIMTTIMGGLMALFTFIQHLSH